MGIFSLGNLTLRLLFTSLLLLAAPVHAANTDDDDDQEDIPAKSAAQTPHQTILEEEEGIFSLSGNFLFGIPAQGNNPQFDEIGYYLTVEPEWKLTSDLSAYGTFLVNQNFSFDDGAYFNQSDMGLRYRKGRYFDGWLETSFSLGFMVPINSLEVTEYYYRGGLAPSLTLTHRNQAKTLETNLSLTEAYLFHNQSITLTDFTNVLSYFQLALEIEYKLRPNWSMGGEINYSICRFYGDQSNGVLGFDYYNSLRIFAKKELALLFGFGNYPVARNPQNPLVNNPAFDQNLDFVYFGFNFEM